MSESDNIRKKMQELKTKENELASLRNTLFEENDKCSQLSKEYEDLKANNGDFIELQQQLDKVMNELVEANCKRDELQKEGEEVQEQQERLQELLEKANDKLAELSDQVAVGYANAERNGSRLAEYQKEINAIDQQKSEMKRTLHDKRTELSNGQKDREVWEELLSQARSLLFAVEATKQLLEENGSLVKENHFAKRYQKEFGKMEQLRKLCHDDRMYLRQ